MKTMRLTFDQLHQELEVLAPGDLRSIKGGTEWGTDEQGNLYYRSEGGDWNLYVINLQAVTI